MRNSVKFTSKGQIQITVRNEIAQNKRALIFELYDTGIGIEKSKICKLF
jgi:signal transduction histidine kinase